MTRGLKPSTITPGTSPVMTVPPPPSYLSKDAKAEWRRVAPILILERKVLTVADMGALENYCIALGTMRELHRLLQAEGHVLPTGKRHPASTALLQTQQQQLRAAAELGLTPSARSRAALSEAAADDEDFL
ncbi:phage terminase small subunit P27 family [Sinorhizobium meliloti WSM1022]|uniref:phage terminase small subunit P27 family n=1 Tax=Rhizobium meliloti TaxID=382 RepID=UPI0004096EB6|nr:phage terminase small subunit P27 family [Sinorhizobium meliloti]MDW9841136.1 phage terminase small subunit P27 family [Sinorhizobium meliloti]QKN13571.1 phage terminase small subunit P27 family [Sinorhizobium meliloti WSM1022]